MTRSSPWAASIGNAGILAHPRGVPVPGGRSRPAGGAGPRLGHVSAPDLPLDAPLGRLRGVGPKLAERLERLGLAAVGDLLGHLPVRYLAVRDVRPIAEWQAGSHGRVEVVVQTARSRPTRRLAITEASGHDEAGTPIRLVWFGQRWLARQLPGKRVVCEGPVTITAAGRHSMDVRQHLVIESLSPEESEAGLRPVYPATEGLSQERMRALIGQALERAMIPDPLPEPIRARLGLAARARAVALIHRPTDAEGARTGRRRIVFDELLMGQIALLLVRGRDARQPAADLGIGLPAARRLAEALPFALSQGQQRLWRALSRRLSGPAPLRALVQGEVGAGKTILAALGLAACAGAGRMAVLLCPTELLARQHAESLRPMLSNAGVEAELITGALGTRERRAALGRLSEVGGVRVAIGTHTLLGDGGLEAGMLARLGLVIVDEQHRFGVTQRHALTDRARRAGAGGVHLLQLSATPIPRSLALTAYGDMDVLTLPGRPEARRRVRTRIGDEEEAAGAIRRAAAAGAGAFVVAPRIGDSADRVGVLSDRLRERLLAGLDVGLVHGRQPADERAATIARFAAGSHQVLLATTVIEVGIDIPAASLMVILGAEAFGLAQLHQLRGRVGRAGQRSECLLVPGDDAPEQSLQRLQALVDSDDGMQLARRDLELRGAGQLIGDQQAGGGSQVAQLPRDARTLAEARYAARLILKADPGLARAAHAALRAELEPRLGALVRITRG